MYVGYLNLYVKLCNKENCYHQAADFYVIFIFTFITQKFVSSTKNYRKYSAFNILYIFVYYMQSMDFYTLKFIINA